MVGATAGLAYFAASGRLIAHRDSYADRGVLHQVFVNEDYELGRLCRNGEIDMFYESCERPLVVDCGANIGASAAWFARRYPKATTLAVEPETDNFALLESNVIGLNVRPLHAAIAGRPGTVQVFDAGIGEWGYRTIGVGTPIGEARAVTLSELLAMAPDCTPFILKIDIEGAEADLFSEEPEVFGRFPLVIVELHDWLLPRGRTSQPFLKWHAARDRDFVQLGENIFSLCNTLLPTGG